VLLQRRLFRERRDELRAERSFDALNRALRPEGVIQTGHPFKDSRLRPSQESGSSDVSCGRGPKRRGTVPPVARERSTLMDDAKVNVLIIDDDRALARALTYLLSDFDVHVVNDARSAVDVVKTGTFDVALVDIHMPVISGMDIYRLAVDRGPDWSRRVIFMTGGACSDETQNFLDAVGNACLEKPFDFESLREHIQGVAHGKA
jgi:CheY-like chemotaxis protein